jgi:glycosyltransferase involved in cell wall biosynthesis
VGDGKSGGVSHGETETTGSTSDFHKGKPEGERVVTPRVSVVTPTRDRLERLQGALAAVEGQHFRDFEIIVVDDGSTDATASWLHSQCSKVRVLRLENSGGAARARNQGIDLARGELIAFLDDDDIWHPAYLEAQVAHLDAHPTATLSYAGHIEMHVSGRASRPDTQPLLTYPSPFIRLLAECFIHTLSVVVCRREAFDRFGRFDESLDIVHDLDWYRRILVGGGYCISLPRLLVERSVPGGLVTSHRKWFQEERTAHAQAFAANPVAVQHERMVRVYRSLFFARVGLARRDWNFGLVRLAAAFGASPYWTIRIAALRLLRQLRLDHRVTQ